MDVRLVQLLSSFIRVSSEYALARLEVAMSRPGENAPPVIERPPDAGEHTLRLLWPGIEAQLDAARAYSKQLSRGGGTEEEWLRRTVEELDQYARAIRWVLTVTEQES